MRNRRSIITIGGIFLALVIAVTPFAAACAPAPSGEEAAPAEAEYNWRFGIPFIGQALRNESCQLFCDLVGVYSDGRIDVEFYPDGLLGSHDEHFHAIQEGSLEFSNFAPYVNLVPGGMLNWMPWTVGTYDEAAVAYAPDRLLFKVMQEAWNEVGAELLFYTPMGPYGIANKVRPLKTPEDFKNLKFRVSASLGAVRAIEHMAEGTGLTCETIPWADLYNALERGVVDACWSLWGSMIEERHFEVVDYYTPLGWCWDCNNVVMNKEAWDSLPADLQDAVFQAGRIAEERDFEVHRRAEAGFIETVQAGGVEITWLTPEERDVFRQKADMASVWEELCDPWLEEHFPGQNMSQKLQDEMVEIAAQCAR